MRFEICEEVCVLLANCPLFLTRDFGVVVSLAIAAAMAPQWKRLRRLRFAALTQLQMTYLLHAQQAA